MCRLKNPTVITIWLLVGFHPATRSVQCTPADNLAVCKERKKYIKVAISVEITVTSVYYQFEITDWHFNYQSCEIYFLPMRSDYNQQPIAILVAL